MKKYLLSTIRIYGVHNQIDSIKAEQAAKLLNKEIIVKAKVTSRRLFEQI